MDERIKEKLINRAKTNPYVNFLGIDFTVIEEGRVEAHMPLHDEQRQYSGVTHGGVLAALADTIAGFAAYTMTPLEKDVLTAELKMSFLRAAWGNELIAKGTVIKAGRNIHFCECEIYCDDKVGEQIFRHLLCGPSPSIEKMLLIYQYHEDFKCKKNPLRLPVVRRYVAGIQPACHESPPDHPCG